MIKINNNITVIGLGYVGSTVASCLADVGFHVICVEKDEEKVKRINERRSPINNMKFDAIFGKYGEDRLIATTDLDYAIKNSCISFVCVNTPIKDENKIDTSDVEATVSNIGKSISKIDDFHVIVIKSTILPRTSENLIIPRLEQNSKKDVVKDFGIVVNPEFLREGNEIDDFTKPDRIVIGEMIEDKRSGDILIEIYKKMIASGTPIIRTDLCTAEMIKYVSNAFLATKISFSNEIGNYCKLLGIDVYNVMNAVGLDHRVSSDYLNAGVGFGGPCLEKDLLALIGCGTEIQYEPRLLNAVKDVNDDQPRRMIDLLESKLNGLKGKKIAVLGLAFKPGTDDVRGSRAIPLIKMLLKRDAIVKAYDPLAIERMRLVDSIGPVEYVDNIDDALKDVQGCLIVTEWPEFKQISDKMDNIIVIEGRRVLNDKLNANCEGICW